jgi:tRNA(Met) C34 N-acetyltransferase TmcA
LNTIRSIGRAIVSMPFLRHVAARAAVGSTAVIFLKTFLDAISEKTLRATVSLSASRGRGKSAAIGLCLAGAIAFGYSNVFVTAPSPENLQATFAFLSNGLKALKYIEHTDFEVSPESQAYGTYTHTHTHTLTP